MSRPGAAVPPGKQRLCPPSIDRVVAFSAHRLELNCSSGSATETLLGDRVEICGDSGAWRSDSRRLDERQQRPGHRGEQGDSGRLAMATSRRSKARRVRRSCCANERLVPPVPSRQPVAGYIVVSVTLKQK